VVTQAQFSIGRCIGHANSARVFIGESRSCIIGGGFFIARHGSTVPLLAALVIGKTVMDLALHRRSNRAG
jgi:uncharacterized protein DUF6498